MSEETSKSCIIYDEVADNASSENETLLEISSSSAKTAKLQENEIARLVQKNLDNLQFKCQFADADTMISLLVPKILYDLHTFDQLHDDLQSIKQSLFSHTQHSKVIDEDIAEIFLDLHNIYSKLDKLDERRTQKLPDKKFTKRLKEAESLLQSKKHFIDNDAGSMSTISMTLGFDTSQQDED